MDLEFMHNRNNQIKFMRYNNLLCIADTSRVPYLRKCMAKKDKLSKNRSKALDIK